MPSSHLKAPLLPCSSHSRSFRSRMAFVPDHRLHHSRYCERPPSASQSPPSSDRRSCPCLLHRHQERLGVIVSKVFRMHAIQDRLCRRESHVRCDVDYLHGSLSSSGFGATLVRGFHFAALSESAAFPACFRSAASTGIRQRTSRAVVSAFLLHTFVYGSALRRLRLRFEEIRIRSLAGGRPRRLWWCYRHVSDFLEDSCKLQHVRASSSLNSKRSNSPSSNSRGSASYLCASVLLRCCSADRLMPRSCSA